MVLHELMDIAYDEIWFKIVEKDGKWHRIWNADYIGGDEESISEIRDLLNKEFDEFDVKIEDDPDSPDCDIPVVSVYMV